MSGVLVIPYKSPPRYPKADAYVETFFRCTETVSPDGSGSMVDSVRGATYTPSTAGVGSTLINGSTPKNSLLPTLTASTALSAGTWPNFRQRSVVVFACGVIADSSSPIRIPIGQGDSGLGFPTTGGLISLSLGGSPHILINSQSQTVAVMNTHPYARWQVPPAGSVVGLALEYEPLGQATPRLLGKMIDTNGDVIRATLPPFYDETLEATLYYEDAILQTTSSGTWIAGDVNPGLNNRTRFGGLALYGFAAFSFPGSLPSREVLDSAYVEMMSDLAAGCKFPPSQFRYLNQIP